MTRFRIPLCAFALTLGLVACDSAKEDDKSDTKEDKAAAKTAEDEVPSCEEVLDHVAGLPDGPKPEADKRDEDIEGCKKETTPEQRTCMVKAASMDDVVKCLVKAAPDAEKKTPSGPSGNGWEKTDFNPTALKNGRLQSNQCNALVAGMDACRKRSDARLGRMNHDLIMSRRTVYMSAKAAEEADVAKGVASCADYTTTLQKNDDCEAAIHDLAKSLE